MAAGAEWPGPSGLAPAGPRPPIRASTAEAHVRPTGDSLEQLTLRKLFRAHEKHVGQAGGSKTARTTFDFLIDGRSLFDAVDGANLDLCGVADCERRDRNVTAVSHLLLESVPPVPGGRQVIFVCPECGDLGCGAITCEVVRDGDSVIWRRFGYENDYDEKMSDFESYAALGPFTFEWNVYRQILATAV